MNELEKAAKGFCVSYFMMHRFTDMAITHAMMSDFAREQIAPYQSRIEKLEKALEHYADESQWKALPLSVNAQSYRPTGRRPHAHGYEVAREALKD
jgi:hypothetical protein